MHMLNGVGLGKFLFTEGLRRSVEEEEEEERQVEAKQTICRKKKNQVQIIPPPCQKSKQDKLNNVFSQKGGGVFPTVLHSVHLCVSRLKASLIHSALSSEGGGGGGGCCSM